MALADRLGKVIDLFYIKPISALLSPTLFRYAVCGGANMVLDLVWYFLIYHYLVGERFIDLGFVVVSPHIASLCVVFPITFYTGFWLNRNVAFQVTDVSSRPQLIKYALSVVGSIILNYVCMKLFVDAFGIWATPSKMLTTAVCAIYSFMAGRYFTFKR